MIEVFIPITCFILGTTLGLLLKGVNITINHKQEQPKQEEYNESMAKYLPAEVQQYYKQTQGQNRF